MSSPDLTRAAWRKSSRSDNNGGACVEVADLGDVIAVRDSKSPHRGALLLSREQWQDFIGYIKDGTFDL